MTMKKSKLLLLFLYLFIHTSSISQVDTCSNRITSLTNNDEDSWIMRANNGKYFVAYFSDSSGLPAIWLTRSSNKGLSWDSTWIAIQTTDSSFYPCMAQAKNGVFHLVWFRIGSGLVEVWYSKSINAVSWSAPVNLTNSPSVDWLPNILIDNNNTIWVTFASDRTGNMELFSIRSVNGGATWSSPVQLTTNLFQDNLPFLFQKKDSSFILIWQRYNNGPYNYLSNTSEIYYKTSPDGITWSVENKITNDISVLYTDAFPSAYQNPLTSEVYINWTTNRFSPQGNNVELSLSAIVSGSSGNTATQISCNGYYARVIPADTAGQFIMTWVADPDFNNVRDIYSRFLNKRSTTDSSNNSGFSYKLSPNPMQRKTTLSFTNSTNEKYFLSLFNSQGIKVLTINNIANGQVTIERKNLPGGPYFFQLRTSTKFTGAGKLIIQ